MDLKSLEVADDEERWIVEGLVVLVELLVGLFEVAALGLVLPGKPAALPNVGESRPAGAGLGDVLLIGIAGTDLVRFCGMRDAENFAEVAEVLGLRRTAR